MRSYILRKYIYFLFFFSFYNNLSARADIIVKKPYLTCTLLRDRVNNFLAYHYLFHDFNPELSKRSFLNYFKLLDPGKLYFTQEDINFFLVKDKSLGLQIENNDCSFISDVYERYKKRVLNASETINTLLNKPFDFRQEEFLETDRKKISWAQNTAQLQDRWRKSLKFILLNMQDSQDSTKAIDRLKKRYHLFEKETLARPSDEIYALFLNAFALALDPHSSFLTPGENAQFQIDFSLKLVGIGATLMSPDGYTTIEALVPGGAAALDGRLKKGDKIIAVDAGDGNGMQDVIDMSLDKVVQLIRGKAGTPVKLLVLPKSLNSTAQLHPIEIKLMRAVVQIKENEAKSDVFLINGKKLGVINLPSFYIDYKACLDAPLNCRSSANDMAREIKKLSSAKVDAILLDLRHNGGGDLSEAQKITGLFINRPIVTQIEDSKHQVHILKANNPVLYSGPLAILISKYTASASEILAGAIQDYGRGLILGDSHTFGKGTVQTVIDIPGTAGRATNGAVHVTIAKFFRPSGKSNQGRGVAADIVIPSLSNASDIGEDEFEYSLPYTTIIPAPHFILSDRYVNIFRQLQDISNNRIKHENAFKKLSLSIEKEGKNTLVSLMMPKKKDNISEDKQDLIEEKNEDLPIFSVKVIRPNDIILKEAAAIIDDFLRKIK